MTDGHMPAPSGAGERRQGRPRKGEDKRTVRVEFVCNEDEYSELSNAAKASRKRLGQYVRETALGRRIVAAVPVADARLAGDLGRIGNNLNQLARLANGGRVVGVDAAELERVAAAVNVLTIALLKRG